jgi:hypothetical protein
MNLCLYIYEIRGSNLDGEREIPALTKKENSNHIQIQKRKATIVQPNTKLHDSFHEQIPKVDSNNNTFHFQQHFYFPSSSSRQ